MRKKRTNTTDIAHRAGVSQSAVSMILNHPQNAHFSPETIRKVLDAADSLGYQKKEKKPVPGLAFRGDIVLIVCPVISNPYYSSLVQAAEQAAAARGYDTVICNTYRDAAREQKLLRSFRDQSIKGILFTCIPASSMRLGDISRRVPVVVIGDRNNAIEADTVEIDSIRSGRLIAEHLHALGHRRIAFISTSLNEQNAVRVNRLNGMRHFFTEKADGSDIAVFSETISPADDLSNTSIEYETGYRLAGQAMKERTLTALVAVNDMVAYGVMDAVLAAGYNIPKDYSVCGFDNIFPSALSFVSLTTVEHCITEKGREAMNLLCERIHSFAQDEGSIRRVEYRPRLIVRKSTGKAPRDE